MVTVDAGCFFACVADCSVALGLKGVLCGVKAYWVAFPFSIAAKCWIHKVFRRTQVASHGRSQRTSCPVLLSFPCSKLTAPNFFAVWACRSSSLAFHFAARRDRLTLPYESADESKLFCNRSAHVCSRPFAGFRTGIVIPFCGSVPLRCITTTCFHSESHLAV
jgi:hypothetical protein